MVWSARDVNSGDKVAVKVVEPDYNITGKKLSSKDRKKVQDALRLEVLNETRVLRRLVGTPNIVALKDLYVDSKHHRYYMVTELCAGTSTPPLPRPPFTRARPCSSPGGDLFDLLMPGDGSVARAFSEAEAGLLLTQAVGAVLACHRSKIAHRDLKLQNLMLTSPTQRLDSLVIIDFGLARPYRKGERLRTKVGTPEYSAPEIFGKRVGGYDQTCDVWSLGVVLYMLLSGIQPFKGPDDVIAKQQERPRDFSSGRWALISDEAKDLCAQLLVHNPWTRIALDRVLDHPWFALPARAKEDQQQAPGRGSALPGSISAEVEVAEPEHAVFAEALTLDEIEAHLTSSASEAAVGDGTAGLAIDDREDAAQGLGMRWSSSGGGERYTEDDENPEERERRLSAEGQRLLGALARQEPLPEPLPPKPAEDEERDSISDEGKLLFSALAQQANQAVAAEEESERESLSQPAQVYEMRRRKKITRGAGYRRSIINPDLGGLAGKRGKLSKKSQGYFGTWSSRFFVADGHYLKYWQTEQESVTHKEDPLAAIDILGVRVFLLHVSACLSAFLLSGAIPM